MCGSVTYSPISPPPLKLLGLSPRQFGEECYKSDPASLRRTEQQKHFALLLRNSTV